MSAVPSRATIDFFGGNRRHRCLCRRDPDHQDQDQDQDQDLVPARHAARPRARGVAWPTGGAAEA